MPRSVTEARWRVIPVLALVLVLAFAGIRFGPGSAAQEGGPAATPAAEEDLPANPEASQATPTPDLPTIPPETEQYAADWPVPNGDLASTRNALDSAINADTVGQLDVAWTFDLSASGFFGAITSNPIIVGETVYIQDMQSNVFALDRASGTLKWSAEFNVGSIGPNGVAVAYGMVYGALSDTGEVVGLNAETGQEVWRQKIGSPPGEGIDMAPIVYDGVVYISTVPGSGAGPTFYQNGDRGVLYALNAMTGEVIWWFDTTNGGYGVPAAAGGGGLWYPPSFDDEGNLYFGVGNPAPWPLTPECPNGSCRPGDNAYTSGMVSLDRETGAVRWFYQDAPHDLLDLDFQISPIITTIDVDGAPTKIAIGAGKTGNVVGVNADTGELLWRTAVGKHQNDDLDELPADPIEIFPGSLGGVETPIAYANGTVFATYLDLPQYQSATGPDPERTGNYADGTGGIIAINVADGSVKWDVKLPTLVVGAATVANNVVFTAGLDGFVRGFDVETGQEIWNWEADLGINAPLAIAGDMLFVGAGFVKFAQVGAEASPVAESESTEQPVPQFIALRIGGASAATPGAEPVQPTEAATTPEPAETEATPAAGTGDGQTAANGITIEMIDIAFSPTEFTIPANTGVTITLPNNGIAIHNFNIDELGIRSEDVPGGGSTTVTINAAPGTYVFYCSVPGHREAGMQGALTVQ